MKQEEPRARAQVVQVSGRNTSFGRPVYSECCDAVPGLKGTGDSMTKATWGGSGAFMAGCGRTCRGGPPVTEGGMLFKLGGRDLGLDME